MPKFTLVKPEPDKALHANCPDLSSLLHVDLASRQGLIDWNFVVPYPELAIMIGLSP